MPAHASRPDTTLPTKAAADRLPVPELDGIDPLSYRVFQALMRTVNVHRQLMFRTLAEEGAHPGQAACLRALAAHDGISQRDLALALHLAPPTVTAMLQRMEKAGAINRRPDRDDQRITRVELTAEGRRLEGSLRAVLARYISQALDSMSEEDRRQLERLLGIMADNAARSLP